MRQGSTFCDAHSSNRSRGTPTARPLGPKPLRRWHEGSSTADVKSLRKHNVQTVCVRPQLLFPALLKVFQLNLLLNSSLKFEDYCLLGYDVRYFSRQVPMFRSNLLSSYSGWNLSPDPCKSSLCGA